MATADTAMVTFSEDPVPEGSAPEAPLRQRKAKAKGANPKAAAPTKAAPAPAPAPATAASTPAPSPAATWVVPAPTFSWKVGVLALVVARIWGALTLMITDCDETFNYWEPAHYVQHGWGFQTWEYSPEYAPHRPRSGGSACKFACALCGSYTRPVSGTRCDRTSSCCRTSSQRPR